MSSTLSNLEYKTMMILELEFENSFKIEASQF